MKHILFTKKLLLSVVALFAIIATSCIKEDLDQCYTLKLKVENIIIIMLLIVIANRTSAGIKARSAASGQITQVQKTTDLPQE